MSILLIAGIAGTLIAILPGFILFLYIARKKGSMWLSAILGGLFWFIALLARTPILAVIEVVVVFVPPTLFLLYAAIVIFIAALMAGLFEEGIKYLFLRSRPKFIETGKHVLSFGLGWGLGEAFIVYVLNVLIYAFLYPLLITWIPLPPEAVLAQNILIGAVERNIAIIFHVSATIMVALAVWNVKALFAYLAILTHFLFDFIPLIILRFVLIPLFGQTFIAVVIVEVLFAIFAVLFTLLANYLWKKKGGPPTTLEA